MFEIQTGKQSEIQLIGRFDASQTKYAQKIFDDISSTIMVNFKNLNYISGAGLDVLLRTQERLKANNNELILINMNNHIQEVFRYAGFNMIFNIQ
jgi:anti-sigma B factor antagonist